MPKEIRFEELNKEERALLLSAFDYSTDKDGFVITPSGSKIPSAEIPGEFLKADNAALIPGSLKVIDGTPTAISQFIREKVAATDER